MKLQLIFSKIGKPEHQNGLLFGALPWNTSKVMAYYDQILVYGQYEEGLYKSAFDGKIKGWLSKI